jgi:hypothetical protein
MLNFHRILNAAYSNAIQSERAARAAWRSNPSDANLATLLWAWRRFKRVGARRSRWAVRKYQTQVA